MPPAGCFTPTAWPRSIRRLPMACDVINFSISGSTDQLPGSGRKSPSCSPADAGVFVAASAGNNGPGAVDSGAQQPVVGDGCGRNAGPRLAGDGNAGQRRRCIPASGLGAAVPSSPLVLSTNAGLPGAPTRRRFGCALRATGQRWRGRSCSPSQGRGQDRRVRPRHQCPRQQEPCGPAGQAALG